MTFSSPLLRFAPSPTGYLHIGNARVALLNALLAQKLGGEFMLRIDDTDTERSKEEYSAAIRQDLQWLGITWQREEQQSLRFDRYQAALEQLKASGRVYPCYDTPEELDLMRKTALGAGRPPIYDRSALRLTAAERAAYEAEGRQPHWRFKLEDSAIDWCDMARGDVHFDAKNLSDPVLYRADGRPLYTITSVVDDSDFSVSHILRGEDHVSNTATQIQLFEALGFAVPEFAHLPLLVGADGKPLSKRWSSDSLQTMCADYEPEALGAFLLALGTSLAAEPVDDLAQLIAGFDIATYGKASPRFDVDALNALNARQLQHGDGVRFVTRLIDDGIPKEKAAEFWALVSANLGCFAEAQDWWRIVNEAPDDLDRDGEDIAFCQVAAALMDDTVATKEGYQDWMKRLKSTTGRKGKSLFMPIRHGLTGRSGGPELDKIIALMGVKAAQKRLGRN